MRSPRLPKPTERALTSTGTQRAARRCSVCPGRPLRSQCIHTKSGLKYLEQVSTIFEVSQQY